MVDGVRVHARVATRPGRRFSVVLVHGLAVSHRYLMPTARLLAAPHDVYVVDLPGFGLSGDPGPALDVPEHAAALAQWLDANRLGPAVLLGNSFGCQVLVELVTREPRALRRPGSVRADHRPGRRYRGPADRPRAT